MPSRTPLLAWLQMQCTFRDCHAAIRRKDIHVIGSDPHSVTYLGDRKLRSSRQQFRQDTFVGWVKVRNQYEGHAGIRRKMLQQLPKRFESAGGCANPHNRERSVRLYRCNFVRSLAFTWLAIIFSLPRGGLVRIDFLPELLWP